MSWQEYVNTPFEIKIEGAEAFYPLWMLENKDTEYNYAAVDLIGVDGTYVPRKKVKGRRGTLKFHFNGYNCFEAAKLFVDASSANSDYWTILHPFDGYMTIQPIKIKEKRNLNNVEFNVSYIETITLESLTFDRINHIGIEFSEYPEPPADAETTNIDNSALTGFLQFMDDVMDGYENVLASITEYREVIADVRDRVREVISNIAAVVGIYNALNSLILDVLRTVCIIQEDISSRIQGLGESIEATDNLLDFYTDVATKHIFETANTTAMAQCCKMATGDNIPYNIESLGSQSVTDNIETIYGGDYSINGVALTKNSLDTTVTRASVVAISDKLTDTFETYVAALEALTTTGADYQYSHTTLEYIYGMYIDALIQSNARLLSSKIEYTTVIESETNLILWCTATFGDCERLDEIIDYNKDILHGDSYMIIKKGQEIRYLL